MGKRLARLTAATAAVALAVVLWGGYARDWRWTGFRSSAALWDWLELIVLPLAVVVAPLWLRHRTRPDRTHHVLLATAVGAFALLVVLGYALNLAWTGFPGNELWDWLELLALPLAIALLPLWTELARGVEPRHAAVATCVLAAFAVAVVGGYVYRWHWTGFQGNTLFDWLKLLIVPLLLPLVLVPLVTGWVTDEPQPPHTYSDGEQPRRTQ